MRQYISPLGLLIGLVLGIMLGLFYARQIDPRVETDIDPAHLDRNSRLTYLIAVSLAYARDRDILRAAERINELGADWQMLADTACDLAESGYASSTGGLAAVRSMVQLADSQGAVGCASALLTGDLTPSRPLATMTPAPSPTPTLIPPPSKTPTVIPTDTPEPPGPTATPSGEFAILQQDAVCDPTLSNLILVSVRDVEDRGLPGVRIEVIWPEGRETFYSGLKAEEDAGFADFQMTPGTTYQVTLPGLSERTRRLEAGTCTTRSGATAQTAYRVIFKRIQAR